ncbi:MAG: glycosyltransferase family 4 protein [Pseudomonadota bacterium]
MATQTVNPALAPAVARLRAAGVGRRMVYVPGPGDVLGTFAQWAAGRDEARLPNMAYSHQAYDVAAALGSDLLTLSQRPVPPGQAGPVEARGATFRFAAMAPRGGAGLAYHLGQVRDARAIGRAARAHGADLVAVERMLAHLWPLARAAAPARLALSLHNTFWPMGQAPSAVQRAAGRLNAGAWRRQVDVTAVASAEIERQLRALVGAPGRVALQLPLYDPAVLPATAPLPPPGPDTPFHIVFLGRLEPNKGVFTLTEAARRLRAAGTPVALSFAGDGSAAGALAAAGEPDTVLHGHLAGPEVFALLQRAHVLACPTTGGFPEGFAMTVVEAMLMGLPAVVSDVVPAAEHLEGRILIHRAGDAGDLAAQLARVLQDSRGGGPLARGAPMRDPRFLTPAMTMASRWIEGLDAALAERQR